VRQTQPATAVSWTRLSAAMLQPAQSLAPRAAPRHRGRRSGVSYRERALPHPLRGESNVHPGLAQGHRRDGTITGM